MKRRDAKYYYPYDKDKCDEVGGIKSRFYQVRYRYARLIETKNCPITYPRDLEDLSPTPWPNPDNSDVNKADDAYWQHHKIIVDGAVNPVRVYHEQFKTGQVPSPI